VLTCYKLNLKMNRFNLTNVLISKNVKADWDFELFDPFWLVPHNFQFTWIQNKTGQSTFTHKLSLPIPKCNNELKFLYPSTKFTDNYSTNRFLLDINSSINMRRIVQLIMCILFSDIPTYFPLTPKVILILNKILY